MPSVLRAKALIRRSPSGTLVESQFRANSPPSLSHATWTLSTYHLTALIDPVVDTESFVVPVTGLSAVGEVRVADGDVVEASTGPGPSARPPRTVAIKSDARRARRVGWADRGIESPFKCRQRVNGDRSHHERTEVFVGVRGRS